MTSDQIRQQFIDFFVRRQGHTFVPSSPVVPHEDPTLLFTNAGMNQFKPIFLGLEKRDYTRAANTQKCIRAGGKHNDLDDVGRSRRHHTFFEMLGNWSFGDYFKREAIAWAWELLTEVWKLDPRRLHATCFEGDEGAGIPRDDDAANLWKEIARLPDDHIHFFPASENFWEMGETGPCGPCTEIHIDRTPDISGGAHVNSDHPQVMEIWNLVFIQYNRNPDGSLTPLPARHVDTGMGFERICQVIQDRQDNYATDVWLPYFDAISQLSGRKYTGQYPPTNAPDPALEAANPQLRTDIAFRVIADHVRCLTFALTDGAVPSNEGRGYVLRRILRRAVRFGRQQLELREPFLHKLVSVVVDSMGDAFPELRKDPKRVVDLIHDEEVSFNRTLDRGIALFEDAASRSVAQGKTQISADDAFMLHDTFGFPIDLTRIMAEERGMSVDIEGFERLMEEARQRARAGGKEGVSRLYELSPEALHSLKEQGVKPTDDSYKFDAAPIGATVRAIWDGSRLIESTHGSEAAGQGVTVILDRTNFYAEMGGQIGDTGELRSAGGAVMDVTTARDAAGYVLHVGNMTAGQLSVGDHVTATLAGVRPRTQKNHTATHLANWALRQVLQEDVLQKGSLVDPDKLRFDFSHGQALTDEEIARVQDLVNEQIRQRIPVYDGHVPQEQGLKINGLRAVFGERYPPVVRIVSIGVPVEELMRDPANRKWREHSIEFCGGTHLGNTADAEAFVITSEEAISKGVRRVVALTGDSALRSLRDAEILESAIAATESASEDKLEPAIASLQSLLANPNLPLRTRRRGQSVLVEAQARWKKQLKSIKAAFQEIAVNPVARAGELLAQAGDSPIIVGEIDAASEEQLRNAIDWLKKKTKSYAILLASVYLQKVNFVAAVSDDLVAQGLKADAWVRQTAKVAGGGGGGRPQMAQAGGKDPARMSDALETARKVATAAIR